MNTGLFLAAFVLVPFDLSLVPYYVRAERCSRECVASAVKYREATARREALIRCMNACMGWAK